MDEETLNSILQEKVKPEVSFLSELNKQEEIASLHDDVQSDTQKSNGISEGKYHCKYSDGFSTDSLPDLMNHYRGTHPEHKGVNRIKKEKAQLDEPKDDNMIDEGIDTSLDIIPVEVESAKSQKTKKEKEKPIAEIPDDYSRLASILKSFGVQHWSGIIEGMKIRDINDLTSLRNYLISVSCPQVKTDTIVKTWAELQGIKTKEESSLKNTNDKPPTPTDALSLMAKLRDEEIQDSIVSSYQEKLKSKKLENELAVKRLNGELMENKNSPDISKIIELEMLKYQLMQPKSNPEVDILKLELERLKMQPKNDPQVDILKQQLEIQNKKYEYIQRKLEEDAKLTQLREEARRDREAFEKRLEELAKQNQELIKTMQNASAPKTEDILKQQIAEIQRQSDSKMQVVLDQLKAVTESKKEEEYRRMIETLNEKIRQNDDINKQRFEQSQGQVAQVADGMKNFATEITHVIEKRDMKDEYTKKEDELKKKISDIEHNRSLSNEQYVMEKTGKIAEEAVKAVGTALDGFGKALQPATQKAAESSSAYERAKLALDLKKQGLSEQTINNILSNQIRPRVPSAQAEWENLQKATGQINIENQQQMQPENIRPAEIPSEPQVEPIKFATGENEK